MSNFYIGQKVQFKEWDEMVEEFGTRNDYINCDHKFTSGMKHLCGTYASIAGIDSDGDVYLADFSCSDDVYWVYSTDMIKPYIDMDKCYLCGSTEELGKGVIEYTDGNKGRICASCVGEEIIAIYDKVKEGECK